MSFLIQRVAKREPGAYEQLIEETYAEAYARLGGDEVRLCETYQAMLAHLDEVTPSTSFWRWFDQIAGTSPAPRLEQAAPRELKHSLLSLTPSKELAQVNSPALRIGRLTLSAWLPALLVGTAYAAAVLPRGPAEISPLYPPALALVGGLLCATLFSWTFGPWLSWWRRALSSRVFLAAAGLLCFALLIWSGAVLAGLRAVYDLGQDGAAPGLLKSLDDATEGLTPIALALAALMGLLGCCLGRALLSKRRWALYRGETRTRRLLGLTVVLPFLGLLAYLAPLLWNGARFDPELEQLYATTPPPFSRGIDKCMCYEDGGQPVSAAQQNKDLPRDFREDPNVASFLTQGKTYFNDAQRWTTTLPAWLREMKRKVAQDRFWCDKEALALAHFAERNYSYFDAYSSEPSAGLETSLEIQLLTRLTLLDSSEPPLGTSLVIPGAFRDGQLSKVSQVSWGALVELALSRRDLANGTPIDERSVAAGFIAAMNGLKNPPYHTERIGFFQSLEPRARINLAWRKFKKGQPEPPEPPPDAKRMARLIEQQKDLVAGPEFDGRALVVDQEVARQEMAQSIVVMELQRRKAAGESLPSRWQDFRPEIERLGTAYSDWIQLEPRAGGLGLRLSNPFGPPNTLWFRPGIDAAESVGSTSASSSLKSGFRRGEAQF